MKALLISSLLLFGVFEILAGSVANAQKSSPAARTITLARTDDYLEKTAERLKQPGMTAEAAAEYANRQLAKQGFNYFFDACSVVEANPHPGSTQDRFGITKSYNYSFVKIDGRRIKMQLLGDPSNALCGECNFSLLLLRVTPRRLLVVAGGRQYWVKRPADFFLKKISLVDSTMKRTLRTWEVPLDTELAGISEDGTKIYLELLNNYEPSDLVDKIVVEVLGSTVRLRARDQVAGQHGEAIEGHPTDPLDAYLTFKRFRVGKKEYIIRYDLPCT